MKELTREELPTDGTHFVVTWTSERWGNDCEKGEIVYGDLCIFSESDGEFYKFDPKGCTNIRYWQFPEGETT